MAAPTGYYQYNMGNKCTFLMNRAYFPYSNTQIRFHPYNLASFSWSPLCQLALPTLLSALPPQPFIVSFPLRDYI
ncbi:hypothetical protein XENTR_v10022625 [Xenopus tropicalis]|nr:hypothetical protein XENTR_v10022625 [Xenopus tropicalis]